MSANAIEKAKTGEVVDPPVIAPQDRFLAMIERAADRPEVLEKIIAVRNAEIARLAQIAFDVAFADMQPLLPPVAKRGDSNNGKYAKWEDIQDKVNPVIHAHGFGLMFKTDTSGGKIKVTAILRHREGHKESTDFELSPDKSGNKQDVHAVASAVSYAKRYAASALLNIRTIGEDDDGNAADSGTINESQAKVFTDLVKTHNASVPRLLKAVGAKTVEDMSPKQLETATAKLMNWVADQKEAKQ